jgi:hypothetical protein
VTDWQTIDTAPEYANLILWNGRQVVYGWRVKMPNGTIGWANSDETWRSDGRLLEPQPTHWMFMPNPPVDAPTE